LVQVSDAAVGILARLRPLFLIAMLGVVGVVWRVTYVHPLDWSYYGYEPPRLLMNWVRDTSAPDAVFFVRDLYYSFLTRVYGGRASFADPCMPFNEAHFPEYFGRMKVYAEADEFGPQDYRAAAAVHGFTHLLIRRDEAGALAGWTPAFESADWVVLGLTGKHDPGVQKVSRP
jgi:hypothetical protein